MAANHNDVIQRSSFRHNRMDYDVSLDSGRARQYRICGRNRRDQTWKLNLRGSSLALGYRLRRNGSREGGVERQIFWYIRQYQRREWKRTGIDRTGTDLDIRGQRLEFHHVFGGIFLSHRLCRRQRLDKVGFTFNRRWREILQLREWLAANGQNQFDVRGMYDRHEGKGVRIDQMDGDDGRHKKKVQSYRKE